MMQETLEMKRTADKILADHEDGFDVMARIDAYIAKYLIPYCEGCRTEFVTPQHDCAGINQRREDERSIKERLDFI